ncbi:hypothetical protein B0T22DRAFT_426812 [Podospora appendiculata]|uniref:SET domain-containing protein n=1 Tax=Podospora appendiculata TaxID=314037 RepID=A0AAE0XA09_9PEZI|nr:hypothetical protein B0T22DRAFT_426812 [Podospora appendiculata]
MHLLLLSLALCAGAIQVPLGLQSPGACLWRPPPPQLSCGLTELDEPRISLTVTEKPKIQRRPVSRWQGPHGCVGEFCLFVNPGFANGRGIVAITTKQTIENLKANLKEKSSTAAPANPATPSFTVTSIKNKGLGLVANTTLHRGDTIMTQTPAILVHRNFLERLPPTKQHALLDDAIARLPAPLRASFLAQMGHVEAGHKITAILATNTFQMNLGGPDGHHYGNFPEVSRFNHDCRPNAAFHIAADRDSSLTHTTTAVRAIQPGEELTISYLGALEPRAARQLRAHHAWGFDCACAQCRLPSAAAAASDARLGEIADIETELADVRSERVTPAMLRRLAGLYEVERLEGSVASAYTLIALNSNMLGEEEMAREFAARAVEALVIENGSGSGDEDAMRALAERPREHFTWRRRVVG